MMRRACWLLLFALLGCAATAPVARGPGALPGERAPEPRKTLTVAVADTVTTLAPWGISGGSGAVEFTELWSNGLVTADFQGNLAPRLATKLPSLDDRSMVILPDGRMTATWTLRPGVKWHDGAPFTADDVVFGWQVTIHPGVPVSRSPSLPEIERIEASDPATVVITWKRTYYLANSIGLKEVFILPKHLLEPAFLGEKEPFVNLPYWTTEYVHLGAFRLQDYGLGETVTLERFDDYFLGRPKIANIILRTIGDPNTTFANLLAGTVDLTTSLPTDLGVRLREQWKADDGGEVVHRERGWRFISIQFNPEWGRPPELRADVRVRRGLYAAIDRDALREILMPGFTGTEADTFMTTTDPRAPLVGTPFARFRYDRALATRELADAGWRRGPDGRMTRSTGEPVELDLRIGGRDTTELSLVAQNWRDLGLTVAEELIPTALARNNEYLAKFPGMEITSQGQSDAVFKRLDSRNHPTPDKRYQGSNAGFYESPALDRLLDRLYTTVNERDQGLILREMGEVVAADLPALPLFKSIGVAVVRQGVRALDDFPGAINPGLLSRHGHLWDRD